MSENDSLITMNVLGGKGRWGNQVFEYAWLRTYAKRYGLDYECSPWVGQYLFGHADPPVTHNLPIVDERYLPTEREDHVYFLAQSIPPKGDELRGRDYNGYCQFPTSWYAEDQDFIRSLFQPTPELQAKLDGPVAELRKRGKTVIGLHMRRGDTGRLIFYLTPNQWYRKWLEKNWSRFEDPVLFIASETPQDFADFADYNPVTSADLVDLQLKPYMIYNYLKYDMDKPTPVSMDWFPDWYFLTQCNVLAIGNSTFSFSAAMIAEDLRELWRSRLSTQAFEKIDPWDSSVLTREDVRDYPELTDTFLTKNPAWIGAEVKDRRWIGAEMLGRK